MDIARTICSQILDDRGAYTVTKKKDDLVISWKRQRTLSHNESTPEVFDRKCRRHVCGPCWRCEHRRLLFSSWLTSASVAYVV